MATTVLIVGAGYTGKRLHASLTRSGHHVFSAQRTAHAADHIAADLDNPASLAAVASAVRSVDSLHVAYLVPPPADLDSEEGRDARLEALLDLLPVDAMQRFVLASTSGVYGDHKGARVDERTAVQPASRRAKARVAAERTLARWATDQKISTVTLRIAGIYGPGRLPLDALKNGAPMVRTEDAGPGNRIHVDDLVRTFDRALFASDPPAIINVCDGDYRTSAAFAADVAAIADLPQPVTVDLATAKRDFSPMRLSFILESRTLDNTVLRNALGVALAYADPLEGIRASLVEPAETGAG